MFGECLELSHCVDGDNVGEVGGLRHKLKGRGGYSKKAFSKAFRKELVLYY